MRGVLVLCCLTLSALAVTGCAKPVGQAAAPSPGDPGVLPTAPLNPSLPPVGSPIATGLRVNGAALLLTFGRIDGTGVVMDTNWYDPRSGAKVSGPAPAAGWSPSPTEQDGFQDIVEYAAPDGQVVDVAWLRGPVAAASVAQDGRTAAMTIALWSADPMVVACWVERSGTAVRVQPGPATVKDAPTFTASNGHGKVLYQQALHGETMPNRRDG